jgi:glutathione S-transferase
MQLIFSAASPFARKVYVLMHEAGLTEKIALKTVQTTAFNSAADLKAANPLAKLPTLITEDGGALFDSRVICRYLDDFAGSHFYPKETLWDVVTLEALADGIAESAVSMVYELRLRAAHEQSPGWIEAQWTKVEQALDALNAGDFSALDGPVNMGQLALACSLGYLDFRHEARAWRDGRDRLSAWYHRFSQRKSMLDTQPDG